MNSFFSMRDPDLCLEDMAYDVVWITPKQMYHFLSAKEIHDFLQEEMTARPERHYVDIVSIKSSPSAADISTVAYEINLVPKEEEKAVYLRCSMAICKRRDHVHPYVRETGTGRDGADPGVHRESPLRRADFCLYEGRGSQDPVL